MRARAGRSFEAALALVVALGLALAASGCSGSKSTKAAKSTTTVTRFPPARPVNNKALSEGQGACGLISQAEVSSAVGLPASPGTGVQTEEGGSSCRWPLRASGTQFVSILEVVNDAKVYEDRIRQQTSGIENLNGLGDHAFLANDTAYVFKGPKLIIVSVVTTQPSATRRTATTKLAQVAAPRF